MVKVKCERVHGNPKNKGVVLNQINCETTPKYQENCDETCRDWSKSYLFDGNLFPLRHGSLHLLACTIENIASMAKTPQHTSIHARVVNHTVPHSASLKRYQNTILPSQWRSFLASLDSSFGKWRFFFGSLAALRWGFSLIKPQPHQDMYRCIES